MLFQGNAVTDCPLCGNMVSYQGGTLSVPAVANLPLLKRLATKGAIWAKNNGTTLENYTQGIVAGQQYAAYFAPAVIQQADVYAQGMP
jgi:hypothetical protein